LGIAQAVTIAMQVLKTLSGFVAGVGVTSHSAQQIGKPAGIEFGMTSARPVLSLRRIESVDSFGHAAQSLLDVKAVYNLDGTREASFQIQAAPSPRMTVRWA
jgi:hypothetical protein